MEFHSKLQFEKGPGGVRTQFGISLFNTMCFTHITRKGELKVLEFGFNEDFSLFDLLFFKVVGSYWHTTKNELEALYHENVWTIDGAGRSYEVVDVQLLVAKYKSYTRVVKLSDPFMYLAERTLC